MYLIKRAGAVEMQYSNRQKNFGFDRGRSVKRSGMEFAIVKAYFGDCFYQNLFNKWKIKIWKIQKSNR